MNLESLFAYEFAFEAAWAAVLGKAGQDVNIDFIDEKKQTPFIDRIQYLAAPTGTRHNHDGIKYWHVWKGPLSTRIVCARDLNSAKLSLMVGRVRIEAQQFHQSFNLSGHLPFHWVNDMIETPPSRGVFPDRKLDWIELHHEVLLNVRPEAFQS